MHGQETQGHAAAGDTGVANRAEIGALDRTIAWQIARKGGQIKMMAEGAAKATRKAVAKAKAAGRACVAHPFDLLKHIFRHRKVRYRGRAQNGQQLHTLFGLAKVMIGARAATT